MDSTKKSFYGRSKAPRTRSGCLQCRQRRVKCDEQKPSCRRCRDGCWTCKYGLQLTWPNDQRQGKPRSPRSVAAATRSPRPKRKSPQRGFVAGSTASSGLLARYSGWLPFVNVTYDDMHFFFHPRASSVACARSRNDFSIPDGQETTTSLALATATMYMYPRPDTMPTIVHFPYTTHGMTMLDQNLFHFYMNGMCPRCILLDKDSESYRKVLVPIALQSKPVIHSILALAAMQMSRRVSGRQYQETALSYRGSSLRMLSQGVGRLAGTASSGHNLSRTEILGMILMLCLYDLMHNTFRVQRSLSNHDWIVHSVGAERLLATSFISDDGQLCDHEISSFLGHLLVARFCLLQSTLPWGYNDQEVFNSTMFWLTKSARPFQEINCFSGCSNELLSILSEITSLIRHYHQSMNLSDSFNVEEDDSKAILEHKLRTLRQELPSHTMPGSEDSVIASPSSESLVRPTAAHRRLASVAAAYRHAALILVQYLDESECLNDNESVREAVANILTEQSLRTALCIPIFGKAARSSLLWPYFIAACHVTRDDELRVRTMAEFVAAMQRDPHSADVLQPMLDVVQDVWKQHDLRGECNGGDIRLGRSIADGSWCFPWERALAHRGWQLSWA